ncbi:hypothetical protein [Nocardia xishanensis]|uniref:hypothetical protein n=1 Tax=Nocardia xishanensis TaxID=238964 RepID=UPI0033F9FA78
MIIASAGADAAGLPNAGHHLKHYLGNTGKDLILDPDTIMNDDPGLKRHVDNIITTLVRSIAARSAMTGGDRVTASFQSGWEDYTFTNRDWYLAIGSIEACACGAVTVYELKSEHTEPRITLDYQVHLYDRYNWDGKKKTEIAGAEWSDRELGALHTAGLAKEFDMYGSSTIKHYEGLFPASGSLDLPAGPGQTPPR